MTNNREHYGVNGLDDSVSGGSGGDVLGLPISHQFREMARVGNFLHLDWFPLNRLKFCLPPTLY